MTTSEKIMEALASIAAVILLPVGLLFIGAALGV